jgi:hypothetical protein
VRHGLCGDDAAGSGPVVHDYADPVKLRLHELSHAAGDLIRPAAGRKRHHEGDRSRRIRLRLQRAGECRAEHCRHAQGAANTLVSHRVSGTVVIFFGIGRRC